MGWRFGHTFVNPEVPDASDLGKLEGVNSDSAGSPGSGWAAAE